MPRTCAENLYRRAWASAYYRQPTQVAQQMGLLLQHRSLRPIEKRMARYLTDPEEQREAITRLEKLITKRESCYPDWWKRPLYPDTDACHEPAQPQPVAPTRLIPSPTDYPRRTLR